MVLMNRSTSITLAIVLMVLGHTMAQQKLVWMPAPVNHPSINASSPFISMDGKGLLFISDNTDGNVPAVFYTSSADEVNWKQPVMLPSTINNRLNHLRGFSLSPDGKQLFITSTKGGGVGGYDLYISDQRGAYWSDPAPVGLPVNSKANEASPTLSADGTRLFFMRCERMDATSASGCKLMMATRRTVTSQWTEPVELPPHINTGNSQTPRIMGDGETIIFASDKLPGKGGMDLFITRRDGDTWTSPIPLDFVNTPGNNQFVSATSTGRYLMTELPGKMGSTELVQMLFPPEVKPKGVMKIEGRVRGLTPPTAAYIGVFDNDTRTKINTTRPDKDGLFIVYLKEGGHYSINVDPEQDKYTFFSKDYDLTEGRINTMDKLDVTLKAPAPGDELLLSQVSFKPYSAELEESSKSQLDKVSRMMKANAGMRFTIEVALYGFRRDSVQSDRELTEITHDTIRYQITSTQTDSTGLQTTRTRDSVVVKATYHNDQTVEQALEVVNYLIAQGAPATGITPSSFVFEAVPEERRTRVKVIVR